MIFDQNEPFFAENVQFCRYIKHFTNKLREPDLEAHFWGVLWEVKYCLKPDKPDWYYMACIKNEYIRLSKQKNKFFPVENLASYIDFALPDMVMDLKRALEKISPKQSAVLRLRFVGGYSIDDISKIYGISRQAVYKCKVNALKKIGQILCG
jgi:DNA-directed RNA polymerase specialized sigma24 family protein